MNALSQAGVVGTLLTIWVVAGASVRGADAVFIPQNSSNFTGGTLEVQGSNGRLQLPIFFQSAPPGSGSTQLSGTTATNSTTYALLTPFGNGNSLIALNDPHTGAYLGKVTLDRRLSDVAYTNGQLYGIANTSNAMQIYSISPTGITQPVINQTVSSTSLSPIEEWRLSGQNNGSKLLAARGRSQQNDLTGYVIDTPTQAVSQVTLPKTKNYSLYDTIINASGTKFTSLVTIPDQPIASFPDGTYEGNRPQSDRYTSFGFQDQISDEFTYEYSPALPALVTTSLNATFEGTRDGLVRDPRVINISGSVGVTNSFAPDDTTLSNVSATKLIQAQGPSPIAYSEQLSAPGDLTPRPIGQFAGSINLANAQRGVYRIVSDTSLKGNYAFNTVTQTDRDLQTLNTPTPQAFAYDPISDNLVGNGDATLGSAGWALRHGDDGQWLTGFLVTGSSSFEFTLTPRTTSPAFLRQILQLPTPDEPVLLEFTYRLASASSPASQLQVSLNGIELTDIPVVSGVTQTYQLFVTDPSLMNLTDAALVFRSTTNGSATSSTSTVRVGSVSLIGIPEPGFLSTLGIMGLGLIRRRAATTRARHKRAECNEVNKYFSGDF